MQQWHTFTQRFQSSSTQYAHLLVRFDARCDATDWIYKPVSQRRKKLSYKLIQVAVSQWNKPPALIAPAWLCTVPARFARNPYISTWTSQRRPRDFSMFRPRSSTHHLGQSLEWWPCVTGFRRQAPVCPYRLCKSCKTNFKLHSCIFILSCHMAEKNTWYCRAFEHLKLSTQDLKLNQPLLTLFA